MASSQPSLQHQFMGILIHVSACCILIISDDDSVVAKITKPHGDDKLIVKAKTGELSYATQVVKQVFTEIPHYFSELDDVLESDYEDCIGTIRIEYHPYMIGAIDRVILTVTYDGLSETDTLLFPR